MSQRQEEGREQAQAELHEMLIAECKPLHDRIGVLKAEIANLQQQISDVYEPHREFLTKV